MRRQLCFQLDHADAGIRRTAVVDTVAHITEPRLQGRRVVFLHGGWVRDYLGRAGDGSPGAADGVQEGHVGFLGVDGEVHGFAGEEVGVEDKVDAAVFLVSLVSAPVLSFAILSLRLS